VSLNLTDRKRERETLKNEQLARENARRSAVGLPAVASVEDLKPEEQPDALRNAAARMAAALAAAPDQGRSLLTQAEVTDQAPQPARP